MTPVKDLSAEAAREHVRLFRRLLDPVWMQLTYQALGNNDRPKDDDAIFAHMGGGCSDHSTFGQFFELMGDPWKAVEEAA